MLFKACVHAINNYNYKSKYDYTRFIRQSLPSANFANNIAHVGVLPDLHYSFYRHVKNPYRFWQRAHQMTAHALLLIFHPATSLINDRSHLYYRTIFETCLTCFGRYSKMHSINSGGQLIGFKWGKAITRTCKTR